MEADWREASNRVDVLTVKILLFGRVGLFVFRHRCKSPAKTHPAEKQEARHLV